MSSGTACVPILPLWVITMPFSCPNFLKLGQQLRFSLMKERVRWPPKRSLRCIREQFNSAERVIVPTSSGLVETRGRVLSQAAERRHHRHVSDELLDAEHWVHIGGSPGGVP